MTNASQLKQWAQSLVSIAQTGLAFSPNLYERERYLEILKVADAMVSESEQPDEKRLQGWVDDVVPGTQGYVTPKVSVGAIVRNGDDKLLLVRRRDNHKWLIPTGWCDVGYSPAEVVTKELIEECGVMADVHRLVGVIDMMRLASSIAHYLLVFECQFVSGEIACHELECEDAGWFSIDALPEPGMFPAVLESVIQPVMEGAMIAPYFDLPRASR